MVCHPCPHSLFTRGDVREELAERDLEVALLPEVEEPKDAAAKLLKLSEDRRGISSPFTFLVFVVGRHFWSKQSWKICVVVFVFPYFFCPRSFVPRKESRRSFGSKGGVTRGREDHTSGGGLDLRETRAQRKR